MTIDTTHEATSAANPDAGRRGFYLACVLGGVLSSAAVTATVWFVALGLIRPPDRTPDEAVPLGSVCAFAAPAASVPRGWLLCDGREVAIDEYPELFEVIGETYGAGSTEHFFRVPDYRGVFLRGAAVLGSTDLSDERDPDRAERLRHDGAQPIDAGSDPVGSYQTSAFGEHRHATCVTTDDADSTDESPHGTVARGSIRWAGQSGGKAPKKYFTLTSAVGGSETRPANIYVHWIMLATRYP